MEEEEEEEEEDDGKRKKETPEIPWEPRVEWRHPFLRVSEVKEQNGHSDTYKSP